MLLSTREADLFESYRGRLEAIAYRLLGSAGDAEDAVQEVFLRWHAADREHIDVPEAWLTKVLTNLCLNQLTSARARRETYVGQWLPEPVLAGDRMLGPADTVEQRESVSFAMLTLMERLSPNERVVYVLREAFGYSHAEVAELLDLTESNCQQIYRRAKQHLVTGRARQEIDTAAAHRIVEEFLAAAASGETEPLVKLLADDAFVLGDGGGWIMTVPSPVVGALKVARFVRNRFRPGTHDLDRFGGRPLAYAAVANGHPAIVLAVGERVVAVAVLEITGDGIVSVLGQGNPAKLDRATRQWAAAEHGEPLLEMW
ncbi:RNA polymerase sigma factor SigJ [Nocardia sp. NPDC050406]|uniref:RNA polymerase sigma factor SigJ n=1 Tax=Nocardia sp. NPDC050406 TaxID=3364318 RepID=UPI00378D8018